MADFFSASISILHMFWCKNTYGIHINLKQKLFFFDAKGHHYWILYDINSM